MQLLRDAVERAVAAARDTVAAGIESGQPAPEWRMRQPPKEWILGVGSLLLVVHDTKTAPVALDRDTKLTVFVGLEGGGRLEAGIVWHRTPAEAKAAGDKLLGVVRS